MIEKKLIWFFSSSFFLQIYSSFEDTDQVYGVSNLEYLQDIVSTVNITKLSIKKCTWDESNLSEQCDCSANKRFLSLSLSHIKQLQHPVTHHITYLKPKRWDCIRKFADMRRDHLAYSPIEIFSECLQQVQPESFWEYLVTVVLCRLN